MNNDQLINVDTGNFEYYTPSFIIEAARTTMGNIDLDPSSCKIANERVKAGKIFTLDDNGLKQNWQGNIWMNHPFGKKSNKLWIDKLVSEYKSGNVKQACCITFAATSEKWFQPLLQFPQCFLSPRTNYLYPNGKIKTGCPKGSVVTYFGDNVSSFNVEFRNLGTIKINY